MSRVTDCLFFSLISLLFKIQPFHLSNDSPVLAMLVGVSGMGQRVACFCTLVLFNLWVSYFFFTYRMIARFSLCWLVFPEWGRGWLVFVHLFSLISGCPISLFLYFFFTYRMIARFSLCWLVFPEWGRGWLVFVHLFSLISGCPISLYFFVISFYLSYFSSF